MTKKVVFTNPIWLFSIISFCCVLSGRAQAAEDTDTDYEFLKPHSTVEGDYNCHKMDTRHSDSDLELHNAVKDSVTTKLRLGLVP